VGVGTIGAERAIGLRPIAAQPRLVRPLGGTAPLRRKRGVEVLDPTVHGTEAFGLLPLTSLGGKLPPKSGSGHRQPATYYDNYEKKFELFGLWYCVSAQRCQRENKILTMQIKLYPKAGKGTENVAGGLKNVQLDMRQAGPTPRSRRWFPG